MTSASSSVLLASMLALLVACVSGQDTISNRLVDSVNDVVANLAPFAEDIAQPEPGPGVCYENRTVSYNTTETVIKIETITTTHFCLDFSSGFKCKKEERKEIPTEVPTVKERDEMIAVCCEKYRFIDGKCVGAQPEGTTKKPNGAAAASVIAMIPLLMAYLL